jgi:hypothetical protein
MGTCQRNRPVSATARNSPIPPGVGYAVRRKAKRWTRGPPRRVARPGEEVPAHGRKRREAMRQHRLSRTPDSQKLAPVTASHVTRRSSRCLPP